MSAMTCPDCNGRGGWLSYFPEPRFSLFGTNLQKWYTCKTCKGQKQVTKEAAVEFLQSHTVSCFGSPIERIYP